MKNQDNLYSSDDLRCVIKGEDGKITIFSLLRCYQDADNYYDANWIRVDIRVNIPGYTASFEAYMLSSEFENLAQQLQKMHNNIIKKFYFAPLEAQIILQAEMDSLGKIEWQCETTHPIGNGATLRFSLTSDQSYLPKLIAELKKMMHAFPIIDALD